jgi:ribonuclease T2
MNKIAPIEKQMEEQWINIEKGTPLDGLWKHEWEKHGTCAATHIPTLNTELSYFNQGLVFLDKFSITKVLSSTYIKPGLDVTYPLQEIYEALKRTLDNNFAIVCHKDQKTKQQFLFEIRICFDKDLNLHSCDGIVMGEDNDPDPSDDIITNCHKDEEIAYPSATWLMQRQYYEGAKKHHHTIQNSWIKHVVNVYKLIRLLQWVTL